MVFVFVQCLKNLIAALQRNLAFGRNTSRKKSDIKFFHDDRSFSAYLMKVQSADKKAVFAAIIAAKWLLWGLSRNFP
jgi:hypothetical protein